MTRAGYSVAVKNFVKTTVRPAKSRIPRRGTSERAKWIAARSESG